MTSSFLDQHLPPATLTIREEADSEPITLDSTTIKALIGRAIRDAGELVSELAAQEAGDIPEVDDKAFGEIVWDVDEDVLSGPVQGEILRLLRVGLVLCIRDAVAEAEIHHRESSGN
jgi:hypothetical protein